MADERCTRRPCCSAMAERGLSLLLWAVAWCTTWRGVRKATLDAPVARYLPDVPLDNLWGGHVAAVGPTPAGPHRRTGQRADVARLQPSGTLRGAVARGTRARGWHAARAASPRIRPSWRMLPRPLQRLVFRERSSLPQSLYPPAAVASASAAGRHRSTPAADNHTRSIRHRPALPWLSALEQPHHDDREDKEFEHDGIATRGQLAVRPKAVTTH